MTRNQRTTYDPTASYGVNRSEVALRLIQLGDNMRLRADLGQPLTDTMVNAYNEAVYQWEHVRIPHQRNEVRR